MMILPKSVIDILEHVEDIYTVLRKSKITFSKEEAMKIVGGRSILERLEATGKIRVEKYKTYRNGQWKCNAEDVIRHAKDRRLRIAKR